MNEKEIKRKVRIRGKGLAVVTFTPDVFVCENDRYLRKQVARTLGMMRDFSHPDVEVLYKFSDAPYHHPLLELIHSNIKKGIRYKEGDRLCFTAGVFKDQYTVEFRPVTVNGENLLRAVVLELDSKYQALSSAEAAADVILLYESDMTLPPISLDDLE